jgi:hypothetical protein
MFAYCAYMLFSCIFVHIVHILHTVHILSHLHMLKLPVGRKQRNKSKQSRSAVTVTVTATKSKKQKVAFDPSDGDIVDAEEFVANERTDRKGRVLTSGGRPSVRKNAVNAKYGTNYRNSTVQRPIMGKHVTLGKACALVGIALYGPNIPLEEAGHEDRLRIFKSAAYYALTDEELEEILDTEEAALRVFIKGVIQAQCRLIKYMGPQTARDEFENRVFHPASKDPVIQKHLGLEMAQSIFDQ